MSTNIDQIEYIQIDQGSNQDGDGTNFENQDNDSENNEDSERDFILPTDPSGGSRLLQGF